MEHQGSEQQDAEHQDTRTGFSEERQRLLAAVELISADRLFNETFYAGAAGISGSRAELIAHYLTNGEAAALSPSREFDVRFYRDTNPDVVRAGGNLLVHYLMHGRSERRYPNRQQLQQDAGRVAASGLFDARAYVWGRGRPAIPGLCDIEDYLVTRDHRAIIGKLFDSDFYARAYSDVLGNGQTDDKAATHAMPILHYIDVGRAELRVCNGDQLRDQMLAIRPHLNEQYYLYQFRTCFPYEPLPDDPLQHYILTGSRLGLDPAPDFSADYYLRRYPDIRVSGMMPFYHYATYGCAEGRMGRPNLASVTSRGETAFDGGKPTILVASHEASRTGAPLVGLNVGARLANTHNVIAYLGKAGPLLRDFAAHSCLIATGPLSSLDAEYLLGQLKVTHGLSAVLLNSVESEVFAAAALNTDIPSVGLIHEFAEYTVPAGRMSEVIERVDRVITPATLVRDSVQAELLAIRAGHANNIMVRPQGYLPNLPEDGAEDDLTGDEILALIGVESRAKVKLVLGAGFVQIRKGVDLFVQTAAEVRRLWGDDVRFVWVGDGYAPKTDLHYSAWVADMVRRLELEDHVFFLPAQSSLDTLFTLSDVFFLPSRLDPFPNVAIDAFEAGRAVVCFDRATGVADALRDTPGRKAAAGTAVAYCNVTQAAEALVRQFKPAEAKRAAGNAALAECAFDFGGYTTVVTEQLAAATVLRQEAIQTTQVILESGLFDVAFHDNTTTPVDQPTLHAAVRTYVARGQKGLVSFNPRPGFNEGVARSRLARPGPALDPRIGPHGSLPTHRCVVLHEDARPDTPSLRTALHLHLHYPELATEFLTWLSAARAPGNVPVDLIVTTTSDARQIEIAYAFRGYKGGSTRLLVVPNRGRDIGPFLTEVGPFVQAGQYDVVGHLHGKRSLAVNAALGDRWRSFLMGTLLGGKAGLPAVLSLFEHDATLGLVFAEDRHCVGWGKNQPFAARLAARMDPQPALPDWPVFPIGTMFWARPAALAPLWGLGLVPRDFPAEPAPYDGTVLHAMERMLPSVCELTGYSWCTVHREGAGW